MRDIALNSFIVVTPLGHKVLVVEDTITRLMDKHPELCSYEDFMVQTLRDPDEIYRDRRGGFHCLKRVHTISDYMVVISLSRTTKDM